MRQIVDKGDGIRVRQVASPRFLEGQFHLEEAAGQIDKVRLQIDFKFHGGEARREGADGDVAGAHDAQIGGRDGEQIPLGARQGRQGAHRRRRRVFLLVAASFRSQWYLGNCGAPAKRVPPFCTLFRERRGM